jgi:hypothetical protein
VVGAATIRMYHMTGDADQAPPGGAGREGA